MTQGKYISIDLFAGAGGMTQGFKQKGFQPIFANDQDKSALATFHKNHPAAIASAEPLENLKPSAIREKFQLSPGKLDLLVGRHAKAFLPMESVTLTTIGIDYISIF